MPAYPNLMSSRDSVPSTTEATAEARIDRVLRSKGRDALSYLRRTGRERLLRELQDDGISIAAAVEILDRAEKRLSSEEFDRFFTDFVVRSSREGT